MVNLALCAWPVANGPFSTKQRKRQFLGLCCRLQIILEGVPALDWAALPTDAILARLAIAKYRRGSLICVTKQGYEINTIQGISGHIGGLACSGYILQL